jgi:hypothetical protein
VFCPGEKCEENLHFFAAAERRSVRARDIKDIYIYRERAKKKKKKKKKKKNKSSWAR